MIEEITNLFKGKRKNRIDIITINHTYSMARLLQKELLAKGYQCEIYKKKPLFMSNHLYIVFAPQIWRRLPKNYCVFQVEQMNYDHWNTEKYKNIMKRSIAVFDYSWSNYHYLKAIDGIGNKLYYFPFCINHELLTKSNYEDDKKYDVIFYGDTSSTRRKQLLDKLNVICNLKVCNNLFGDELTKELKKAYIVINIHYKDNAILETCRICEILSYGNNIVLSESSIDEALDNEFFEYVDFVESGDEENILNTVKMLLGDKKSISDKIAFRKATLLSKGNEVSKYVYEYF